MDEQNLGYRIRQFLRDLFGSRLVLQLENDLANLRNDYEHRLNDRDETIVALRTQIAASDIKLERFESMLLPNLFKPKINTPLEFISEPDPSSWEGIQRAWYKKQEEVDSGVPESIRQEIQQ